MKKYDWLLIITCWLIMQGGLVFYLGINSREESLKYIELASHWSRGDWHFKWNQIFYSGYTGIHVLLKWVGLPPESMYVIQLFFSWLSVYYFVKIMELFISSGFAILASGILYSTCFFIQQWVSALFTDSIFSSMLVIAIYLLLTEDKSRGKNIMCWILLIILPLFRPVGFLFLLLACFYWLFIAEKRKTGKLIFCAIYLSFLVVIINKSLVENPLYFYPNHNAEANIICGYPSNLLQYQKVPYRKDMGMFSYLVNNPGMTLRLFFFRFIKVFSMTREYFSAWHNALITGISTIYFILAFAGSVSLLQGKNRIWIFLLAGILIFSLPAVVFCVEWAGRFSLPVYCFILILCGFGIDRIRVFRHSASS